MTLLADSVRNILNQAIMSDIGITVRVEVRGDMIAPARRAREVLYRFKRENADFKNLQIVLSPDDPNNELWLICRQGETPDNDPTPVDIELDP